jgi:acyl-CoA dehydrogenase
MAASVARWVTRSPSWERLGESLIVEPVVWSAVLGTQLLVDASAYRYRADWLSRLVDGRARAVLAHADVNRGSTYASREGSSWLLRGAKRLVMGGDQAQLLIVSARLEGGGTALFGIDPGHPAVTLRAYRTHDGRSAADLQIDNALLDEGALLAGPERAASVLEEARSMATVALCAESVGAMRRALALTVDYLRTRQQFGHSLADNQALQHRVAEHYRAWTNARALVREAALAWSGAPPLERARRISAAKWMCARAGRAIAMDVLQLYGAVGMQDETAISHFAKRLAADAVLLGDANHHLGQFVAAAREQRDIEGRSS